MQPAVGKGDDDHTGNTYRGMRYRKLALALIVAPALAWAQQPPAASPSPWEKGPGVEGFNTETRAVLLANRPKDMPEADWLKLMAKPVNRSLYPLRITQAMLDTLDATQLDPRYRYVMSTEPRR